MFKKILYLPLWFFKNKFLGKKIPLQSVVFISDACNLRCKHCCIYPLGNFTVKHYEQIKDELEYCYRIGSRFIDFEGGEPTMWRDGDRNLNDLIALAKQIGFFSTTVTTNAQLPFRWLKADSIWVSLDGVGKFHDEIRGEGAFEKLLKNIEDAQHPHLSVNMVVNALNYTCVEETIEWAKAHPHIEKISINFHTPYPGTEYLLLDRDKRNTIIDKVIAYKQKGYPIMNSISGLKNMKDMHFKKYCWMANFIYVDGARLPECNGSALGLCAQCGFCMAGEMNAVMRLKPDTIRAGMTLRI